MFISDQNEFVEIIILVLLVIMIMNIKFFLFWLMCMTSTLVEKHKFFKALYILLSIVLCKDKLSQEILKFEQQKDDSRIARYWTFISLSCLYLRSSQVKLKNRYVVICMNCTNIKISDFSAQLQDFMFSIIFILVCFMLI